MRIFFEIIVFDSQNRILTFDFRFLVRKFEPSLIRLFRLKYMDATDSSDTLSSSNTFRMKRSEASGH